MNPDTINHILPHLIAWTAAAAMLFALLIWLLSAPYPTAAAHSRPTAQPGKAGRWTRLFRYDNAPWAGRRIAGIPTPRLLILNRVSGGTARHLRRQVGAAGDIADKIRKSVINQPDLGGAIFVMCFRVSSNGKCIITMGDYYGTRAEVMNWMEDKTTRIAMEVDEGWLEDEDDAPCRFSPRPAFRLFSPRVFGGEVNIADLELLPEESEALHNLWVNSIARVNEKRKQQKRPLRPISGQVGAVGDIAAAAPKAPKEMKAKCDSCSNKAIGFFANAARVRPELTIQRCCERCRDEWAAGDGVDLRRVNSQGGFLRGRNEWPSTRAADQTGAVGDIAAIAADEAKYPDESHEAECRRMDVSDLEAIVCEALTDNFEASNALGELRRRADLAEPRCAVPDFHPVGDAPPEQREELFRKIIGDWCEKPAEDGKPPPRELRNWKAVAVHHSSEIFALAKSFPGRAGIDAQRVGEKILRELHAYTWGWQDFPEEADPSGDFIQICDECDTPYIADSGGPGTCPNEECKNHDSGADLPPRQIRTQYKVQRSTFGMSVATDEAELGEVDGLTVCWMTAEEIRGFLLEQHNRGFVAFEEGLTGLTLEEMITQIISTAPERTIQLLPGERGYEDPAEDKPTDDNHQNKE